LDEGFFLLDLGFHVYHLGSIVLDIAETVTEQEDSGIWYFCFHVAVCYIFLEYNTTYIPALFEVGVLDCDNLSELIEVDAVIQVLR